MAELHLAQQPGGGGWDGIVHNHDCSYSLLPDSCRSIAVCDVVSFDVTSFAVVNQQLSGFWDCLPLGGPAATACDQCTSAPVHENL
jgi:hypothetical protein